MYLSKMDHQNNCSHSKCTSANESVCQTLSEMDWERGIWNAAFSGDIDRVETLLDKARDAKECATLGDKGGYTALHYAARGGHAHVCRALLARGADPEARTASGRATPLHKAAAAGKVNTVKCLIQSGARVDAQDVDGRTALHKAVENNRAEVASVLVAACPGLARVADARGRLALAPAPQAAPN